MQAAAGALAAAAAVVGLILVLIKDEDTPPTATTTSALRSVIALEQAPNNAVVPIAVSDLSTPPRYERDVNSQEAHCGEWAAWLESQRAASFSAPALKVSAPAGAAVTVTSVRVKIHRVEQPPEASMIMCVYGAGGYEPTYVRIDLRRPSKAPTLSQEEKGGEIGPIPNAVFTVAPGRTERLELQAGGEPGVLYEWGVEVDVTVDQRTETIAFGTASKPLRSWSVDAPSPVDYDPATQQWRPAPF